MNDLTAECIANVNFVFPLVLSKWLKEFSYCLFKFSICMEIFAHCKTAFFLLLLLFYKMIFSTQRQQQVGLKGAVFSLSFEGSPALCQIQTAKRWLSELSGDVSPITDQSTSATGKTAVIRWGHSFRGWHHYLHYSWENTLLQTPVCLYLLSGPLHQDLSLHFWLTACSNINMSPGQHAWLMAMCWCQPASDATVASSRWRASLDPNTVPMTQTQGFKMTVYECVSVCERSVINSHRQDFRTPEDDDLLIHKHTSTHIISLPS